MNGVQIKELLDTVSEKVRKATVIEVVEKIRDKSYLLIDCLDGILDEVERELDTEVQDDR